MAASEQAEKLAESCAELTLTSRQADSIVQQKMTEHDLKVIFPEDWMDNEIPVLNMCLSHKSVLNPQLFRAVQQEEAAIDSKTIQSFVSIGKGFCAETFDQVGTGKIVKRAHKRQVLGHAPLWTDFVTHNRVEKAIFSAFDREDVMLSIPQVYNFVSAQSSWWAQNTQKWHSEKLREPMDVIEAQKIAPLPGIVRETLISRYCSDPLQPEANKDMQNRDCLVRVYLGARRPYTVANIDEPFTLRNFELDLTRARDISLDMEMKDHAKAMGIALAAMHWVAKTDANDVEFVLGSPPADLKLSYSTVKSLPPLTDTTELADLHRRRAVHLWLLDFNNCSDMPQDQSGIELAVKAYWTNDPYYPRPVPSGSRDVGIWLAFRDAYLEESKRSADAAVLRDELPTLFIRRLVEEAERRDGAVPAGGPPRGGHRGPARGGRRPNHGKHPRGGSRRPPPDVW